MPKTNLQKPPSVIIYQAPNGAIELKGDFEKETVRANRMQMSEMFGVNPQAISKHIHNLYKEEELVKEATSSKMELVQEEAWRLVKRNIDYYNLDVLIAVGYRINSVVGTRFRQRATQTLKDHITKGYTINPLLLQKHYNLFIQALDEVKRLAHNQDFSTDEILELVKLFGQTRLSIDAFDRGKIITNKQTQKTVQVQAKELYTDLLRLKADLLTRDEATDFFAQERESWEFEGIFWNVFQSAFGEDVYPSIESKAAHLLYFIVKNHPFVDGNKRSGAFAFIRLLQKAKIPFKDKITPEALTILTLLIATSNPKDKEKLIDLVIMLLGENNQE